MKKYYKKFREKLESYFKQKHSEKIDRELERFYEENFADQEYEDPMKGIGMGGSWSPDRVVNDVKEGVKKIPGEAKRLNLPVVEVAGFCFHRLLSDATVEVWKAHDKIPKHEYFLMGEKREEPVEMEFNKMFGVAFLKMEACMEIAKDFDLGADAVHVTENNLEMIERLGKLGKAVNQTFEDEKYEGTRDMEKFKQAFDDLIEKSESYYQEMSKEKKILLNQDLEKWEAVN